MQRIRLLRRRQLLNLRKRRPLQVSVLQALSLSAFPHIAVWPRGSVNSECRRSRWSICWYSFYQRSGHVGCGAHTNHVQDAAAKTYRKSSRGSRSSGSYITQSEIYCIRRSRSALCISTDKNPILVVRTSPACPRHGFAGGSGALEQRGPAPGCRVHGLWGNAFACRAWAFEAVWRKAS